MRRKNKGLSGMCIIMCLLALILIQPVKANAAKTKKMYLVTAISNDGYVLESFSYNKNGTLKKSKNNITGDTYIYNYNKKQHISSINNKFFNSSQSFKYKYDKKNHLTNAPITNYKYKFSWKKNKLTTATVTHYSSDHYNFLKKYSYNKKGYVKQVVTTQYNKKSSKTANYTWNKQGDLIKIKKLYGSNPESIVYSYKWTYKKGKPVKKVERASGSSEPYTTNYQCKAVKVPAKYVKVVEAQQRCIRNTFDPGSAELGLYNYFGDDKI